MNDLLEANRADEQIKALRQPAPIIATDIVHDAFKRVFGSDMHFPAGQLTQEVADLQDRVHMSVLAHLDFRLETAEPLVDVITGIAFNGEITQTNDGRKIAFQVEVPNEALGL